MIPTDNMMETVDMEIIRNLLLDMMDEPDGYVGEHRTLAG